MRFHAGELYLGTDVKWKVLSGFYVLLSVLGKVAHLISDSAQSWNVCLTEVLKASTNGCLLAKQNQNKLCGDELKIPSLALTTTSLVPRTEHLSQAMSLLPSHANQ